MLSKVYRSVGGNIDVFVVTIAQLPVRITSPALDVAVVKDGAGMVCSTRNCNGGVILSESSRDGGVAFGAIATLMSITKREPSTTHSGSRAEKSSKRRLCVCRPLRTISHAVRSCHVVSELTCIVRNITLGLVDLGPICLRTCVLLTRQLRFLGR